MRKNQQDKKKICRNKFSTLRSKVLPHIEMKILEQVKKTLTLTLKINKEKGHLGIYWPLIGEVDLRQLKKDLKIPIALPAANDSGKLSYHSWTEKPLRKDSCGIPAPLDEPKLKAKQIQVLLVPALSIDQNFYRLGYGGGFFDRLRCDPIWREIPSFVIIPEICISKEPLPRDNWDIPFDGWITESGKNK